VTRAFLVAALLAAPASAQELFAGLSAHDTRLPITDGIDERGVDLQLGFRARPLARLAPIGAPAPYLLGSLNSAGDTSFVAAGLSWKFGREAYLRPGLGVAVHTGPDRRLRTNGDRSDLGSRITFEPELAAGFQLRPHMALEVSWTHLSHAWLFSRQNPGLDMLGLRLNFGLR
jgi:lipid A 3-O-deacylase